MKLLVSIVALFGILSTAQSQCVPSVSVTFTGTPGEVIFTNTSTGGTANTWYLLEMQTSVNGGGSVGSFGGFLPQPQTYGASDTYPYCISMTDSMAGCNVTVCDSVTITNMPYYTPDPYFDAVQLGSIYEYNFDISASTGTGTVTHEWDFGDGTFDYTASPNHIYNMNGTFQVCHTVTQNLGMSQLTYCADVIIAGGGGACQANYTWVQDSNAIQTISVTNTSTGGGGMTYLWDFGDGTILAGQYPSHTYANLGAYMVCLTISDSLGCTSTYCDSIAVYPKPNGDYLNGKLSGFTINVVSPFSGVEEMTMEHYIYPNPATDLIYLSVTGEVKNIQLLDMKGQLVLDQDFEPAISVAHLDAGMYFIKIDGINVTRLIKQ